MKRVSLALVVFASALVAAPSGICDSFGYSGSGIESNSHSGLQSSHASVSRGVAGGVFANDQRVKNGTEPSMVPENFNATGARIEGAYLFENVLNSRNAKTSNGTRGSALIELDDHELILLAGDSHNSAGDGELYFADKGAYRASSESLRGNGDATARVANLTVTPEPGSLFLLGTGLLGLAMVLFWRSAKRSASS